MDFTPVKFSPKEEDVRNQYESRVLVVRSPASYSGRPGSFYRDRGRLSCFPSVPPDRYVDSTVS